MQVPNSVAINAAFTRNSLRQVVSSEECVRTPLTSLLQTVAEEQDDNRAALRRAYQYAFHNYRNEYIYKNTLLTKILLGRHSIRTSSAFEEMPIADSIADFLIINGKAVVYEVKTDLDNCERLESQLADYYTAFDNVCIVCGKAHRNAILHKYLHTPVGLLELNDRGQLSVLKESEPLPDFISPHTLFRILRKSEREEAIINCGGVLPVTTQVRYYRECEEEFCGLPLESTYPCALKLLKRRREKITKPAIELVPSELKLLGYMMEINQVQAQRLDEFLKQPVDKAR